MRNYICKWPNGDLVFISARDKQQVREILDEVADPGSCDIKRFKGPVAMEFYPKIPKPPPRAKDESADWRLNLRGDKYVAPEDPKTRPSVVRWAGNRGQTFYADIWQEAGGQLSADEAAALQRWRTATQQQAAAPAQQEEPWVTEQQLQETGMLENPYHIQIKLGPTDTYGNFSSRFVKTITKEFFPRTHAALKPLAALDPELMDHDEDEDEEAGAVMNLRAALSTDIYDQQKIDQMGGARARKFVAAASGDRNALLQVMMDQTANVYGPEDDDDEDDDDDDDDDYEDDDSDVMDVGGDFMRAIRHGRAMDLAATLGVNP